MTLALQECHFEKNYGILRTMASRIRIYVESELTKENQGREGLPLGLQILSKIVPQSSFFTREFSKNEPVVALEQVKFCYESMLMLKPAFKGLLNLQ